MDFVHLHVHTHYSMQSSPIFPDQLFSAASSLGMKSIAVTDYCAMFNMPELFNEARTSGVKLIIGSELLLLESDAHQQSKTPASPSVVLLVMNETGYRNLSILLSRAAKDGFVSGMPHIESGMLERYHDGLLCLSAYNSGRIGRELLAGSKKDAERFTAYYQEIFGDNFYLELQRHNTPFDEKLNRETLELADRFG
ncbi:MAG: PHP domain-containing protein, partial [Chlorobiaceae bacterium]|nr:PHP domain-containing protein [Chlorobiaceae bacterium]